jgi:4-carboxymuconolactone decarboxylase
VRDQGLQRGKLVASDRIGTLGFNVVSVLNLHLVLESGQHALCTLKVTSTCELLVSIDFGDQGLADPSAINAGQRRVRLNHIHDGDGSGNHSYAPVKRNEMDEKGKELYDEGGPEAAFGPGRIRLYSPAVAVYMHGENDYLRKKSGLETRLAELTILVTAREMNSEYVWTAHEPLALKAGLQSETINIIKYRKPLNGLGEKEANIIQLGREAFGKHKVNSDTFARALKSFGDRGAVNVVALMGDYASTAILLTAFDQHVRPAVKPLLPIS